jgi:methyl-accepting chemotaxis protein
MFASLSVRAKLTLLIAIALTALAATGLAGWAGIRGTTAAIKEIGEVRLPSVLGLEIVNEGQTAVRSTNLTTAIYENDYEAHGKFADVLKKRKEVWDRIEKGWKIYEPLPQTKEEEVLWKQFEKEWAEWKSGDNKIGGLIEALSKNKSEAEQKSLFDAFYKQLEDNAPRFAAAETTLGKIIDLNVKYGDDSVKDGNKEASQAQTTMIIVAAVAALLLSLAGILILRSLLKQLGGEPAYVAEVVAKVAAGDLTVQVKLNRNDVTSMLAAVQGMIAKLAEIIGEVTAAADALANAAGQVSATSQSLSQSSSEQAASVEETTASIEQMTASITQNTENAKVTDNMATKSSSEAQQGG